MGKEKNKFLRRRAGWVAIKLFSFLSGSIPLKLNYFLGGILGNIGYLAFPRHRRIALEGLGIAFPQQALKTRKSLARNFFIFISQSALELLYFLQNLDYLRHIRIEGAANLDRALKKGRGVIILTAHLGNFPLMSLKLAKQGYSVYFVTRPMRDERAGDHLYELRSRAGVKTIFSYPRKECVSGIIKALGNNEIVVMQMDQNFGTGGVWVKFFGKLAATPVGPIVLALRTKAAVVPAYIYREGTGQHCIKIFPDEELSIRDDKDETVLINTIKFTRLIEGWVKKATFQWGWIHRRWKSRPSREIEKLKFRIER